MQAPNGPLATAMSFIPPFTPLVMLLRQAMPGGVPFWQPWVGLLGVVAWTFVVSWIAARIFRIAVSDAGKDAQCGSWLAGRSRGDGSPVTTETRRRRGRSAARKYWPQINAR